MDKQHTNEEKLCVSCSKPIKDYAGNPSMWGTFVADTENKGKMIHYHCGCLTLLITELRKQVDDMADKIQKWPYVITNSQSDTIKDLQSKLEEANREIIHLKSERGFLSGRNSEGPA